jgi:ABC-type lipoprotein release transport system permease subunit
VILLVSMAWRNLWRQRRRSLITAFAMAAGVAVVMACMAVTDGMYTNMFEIMVEQSLGHVQVHHPAYPANSQLHDTLRERDALLERIEAIEGTVAASPALRCVGLIGGESTSSGGMLVGIEPARDQRVSPLMERVREGAYLSEEPNQEILLGFQLAEEIEVGLDDEVVVLIQAADGSTGNELFRVVGLFRTGDPGMDAGGAYLHIADAEQLTALEDQAHGVTVLTGHEDLVEPYSQRLRAALGSDEVEVQAWWEVSPQIEQLLQMRDVSAFVTLGLTFFVAAFGVINTMLMSVFERTRELGVLRALGLRRRKLVWLVVLESLFLAALACAIGLFLGGLMDWYLVVHGLDMSASMPDGMAYQGVILDPVWYAEIRIDRIVTVVVSVFVISILASLWPAWRAARLQPVAAMRAE